jgi:hypothetical protein
MSKYRVLRRISRQKKGKMVGGWRKLYIEELHNLCPSTYIIKMIKLREMDWAGRMEGRGMLIGFWLERQKE